MDPLDDTFDLDDLIFAADDNDLDDPLDGLIDFEKSPQRDARKRDQPVVITDDRRYIDKQTRHEFKNSLRRENAIDALGGLPDEGVAVHQLMSANYDSFDLVAGIMHYRPGVVVEEMFLASLGFNARNATTLIDYLKSGRVKTASILVSAYYEANRAERDVCYSLETILPEYGGFYCAARSHAKLMLVKLANGEHYVIESSANLRTCRCIEQFTIYHHQELYEFHTSWIKEVAEIETKRRAGRNGHPVTGRGNDRESDRTRDSKETPRTRKRRN
jgi:hypothetical protein